MSQAVAPPPAASYAAPTLLVVPEDDPPVHLLSEAALAEDWLSPKDEEAWKAL